LVLRYRKDNQNPYIEERQTLQWPQEQGKKDKQQSIKHSTKRLKMEQHEPNKNVVVTQVLWSTLTHPRFFSITRSLVFCVVFCIIVCP